MRSITLERKGRFEIGVKFLNSEILVFLEISVIIACLKQEGMDPVDIDLLTILGSIGNAVFLYPFCLRDSFNKNVGMGSSAQDLVGDFIIYLRNSSEVIVGNCSNWLSHTLTGKLVHPGRSVQ